ncbi:post-GPI attachment to proteins factor 3 precursor [Backusella circina FSU 941]|nr:post-GPI attachment to proteins factor 3 precursor [Backusella circina FSU 941]
MSKNFFWLFSLFFLVSFFQITLASVGDEQPIFIHCVDECVQFTCPAQLDFYLRLFHWTCPENCRYVCMQVITDNAEYEGLEIYQYFGKWPFYRVIGIQEPASVIFSIGNGLVHLYFFFKIRKEAPNSFFLKPFMVLYTLIGMNAWWWSTVFHSRDMKITELLDYFSAGLLVLYSLYYAILRVFSIQNTFIVQSLGILFICLFVGHVAYLVIVTFDYVYNMFANVAIGVLQESLWIGWYISTLLDKNIKRPYAYLGILSGVGVSLAMCLELFDFPPLWRVFDAHSLWHLATIPLTIIWYKFLLEDSLHEVRILPYFTKM